MPDFGPQSAYIIASYAIAALILGGMIVVSFLKRSAARTRLAALEGTETRDER